ncbi:MAG: orotidine-5'-phosphate decarboxylase [Gemmatimonadota bacterium]|nr:orotidine-5'-phosphate decarboxylase [Gemmatimonadota bacterium]
MTTSIPIVALDVASAVEAMAIARTLGDTCRFFKVGNELFTAAGPSIVRSLQDDLGAEIFLDLKFHDIPNTVAGAVRQVSALGVRLTTVHASGGPAMLRAAQEAAGARCGVMAVTVLTSFDAASLATAWGRTPLVVESEVLRLASDAASAGLHGLVCSGAEAGHVAASHPGLAVLVPGIRMAGGHSHDQQRVVTPAAAQASGARYLVLGRAVTAAGDPRAAMQQVLAELGASEKSGSRTT